MKAYWLTDIHLNFLKSEEIYLFFKKINESRPDIILITGDIGESNSIIHYLQMFEEHFDIPIYFVLGNHDYYHGSISQVNNEIKTFTINSSNLHWLDNSNIIKLSENTSLIGHSSWADGQFGNYNDSNVMLNDYVLIDEFKSLSKAERLYKMRQLAQEAANHLDKLLSQALELSEHIICLTHAPPFKEACWHNGQISNSEWLPHFSCKAVGDILLKYMSQNKEKQMTVLCGHTHSGGYVNILDNLSVYTGKAVYGSPEIQKLLELK